MIIDSGVAFELVSRFEFLIAPAVLQAEVVVAVLLFRADVSHDYVGGVGGALVEVDRVVFDGDDVVGIAVFTVFLEECVPTVEVSTVEQGRPTRVLDLHARFGVLSHKARTSDQERREHGPSLLESRANPTAKLVPVLPACANWSTRRWSCPGNAEREPPRVGRDDSRSVAVGRREEGDSAEIQSPIGAGTVGDSKRADVGGEHVLAVAGGVGPGVHRVGGARRVPARILAAVRVDVVAESP